MKNLLKFALIAALTFGGCAFNTDLANTTEDELPEIDTTYVGQEHFASDEWLTVPLEELPFLVQMPSWWTFSEDANSYTLTFDDGVLGEVIFGKTTTDIELDTIDEMGPVYCYDEIEYGESCAYINDVCTEQKCVVYFEELGEKYYPLTVWDKGLDENQQGIITQLLSTIELD